MKLENIELDIPPTWIGKLSRYLSLRPVEARGLLDMPMGLGMVMTEIRFTSLREFMAPPR